MATIAIGVSPSPSKGATAKVPVNALAEDGVPPEQGDTFQCSISGKVQSVSGSTATVSIDSINGEPVSEEASETPQEEAAEPETGTEQGPSGASSGASPRTGLDMAPLRTRLPRAKTAAMGANLLKGARGRALPF